MNTTHQMILEAETEAFNSSDDSTPQPALLEEVETDLYTREMLPQIAVSEAVRTVCLAELATAKKRSWRIR